MPLSTELLLQRATLVRLLRKFIPSPPSFTQICHVQYLPKSVYSNLPPAPTMSMPPSPPRRVRQTLAAELRGPLLGPRLVAVPEADELRPRRPLHGLRVQDRDVAGPDEADADGVLGELRHVRSLWEM